MAPKLGSKFATRTKWWTKERIIEAGAMFYREFGCTPTNDGTWNVATRYTARSQGGFSNAGKDRPYPSMGPISNFWRSLRDFWNEVAAECPDLNIVVDRGDMPWSPLEEWFITESVGVMPRSEVARLMAESGVGRTEPAIKRRLYELGVNSYNRWGLTINRLSTLLGVGSSVIQKYIDHGLLPFFQGNKCLYVDPADILVIQEYDWSKADHPAELEAAVRKALIQRACFVLLGFDYRRFSYHKVQPRRDLLTGRIKQKRGVNPPPVEPKPKHARLGDWVEIVGPWARQAGARGRVGQIKNLVWSPQRKAATQKNPARPACWMATVEFRKLTIHGRPDYPRTHYNVPASFLKKTKAPEARPAPTAPPTQRRDRKARQAVLALRGRQVLSHHLNLPLTSLTPTEERNANAKLRGQKVLGNRLNVPNRPVDPPKSQRGKRTDLKWKIEVGERKL